MVGAPDGAAPRLARNLHPPRQRVHLGRRHDRRHRVHAQIRVQERITRRIVSINPSRVAPTATHLLHALAEHRASLTPQRTDDGLIARVPHREHVSVRALGEDRARSRASARRRRRREASTLARGIVPIGAFIASRRRQRDEERDENDEADLGGSFSSSSARAARHDALARRCLRPSAPRPPRGPRSAGPTLNTTIGQPARMNSNDTPSRDT